MHRLGSNRELALTHRLQVKVLHIDLSRVQIIYHVSLIVVKSATVIVELIIDLSEMRKSPTDL